jgi:hypothetical protein
MAPLSAISLDGGSLAFGQLQNELGTAVTPGVSFKGMIDEVRLWGVQLTSTPRPLSVPIAHNPNY